MESYRTHVCSQLNSNNLDEEIILSGWLHRKRDHGNLLFIDLRDNYGITQCVVDSSHTDFNIISNIPNESVPVGKGEEDIEKNEIPQVNKHRSAVIASAIDPTTQRDLLINILCTQPRRKSGKDEQKW